MRDLKVHAWRWVTVGVLLLLGMVAFPGVALATPEPPQGPIYIVQPGDTLADIARRFGVPLDALVAANGLSDPNRLTPGEALLIPGLEGVEGVLTTTTVGWGESLTGLSRRYGVPEPLLRRLNHLLTEAQLYAGRPLVVPQEALGRPAPGRVRVLPEEGLVETAARVGVNPWVLVLANDLPGTWAALPDEVLQLPLGREDSSGPSGLPPEVRQVILQPEVWRQGSTVVIRVRLAAAEEVTLDGWWGERVLHFFPVDEKGVEWVALQGVHAMEDVGLHPLALRLTYPDGHTVGWEQSVRVVSGGYLWEKLVVPVAYLDPEVNRQESQKVQAIVDQVTPRRYWDGPFQPPSPYGDCFTSRFGTRRDYNDGMYYGYHSGVDFCGGTGVPIYAPADGVVVFAGPLEVRGNATIIDHGWGVFTGYWHQSEILVQPGQRVRAGEVIGYVGATGRVTGAHLHWELWVGGVPVNPVDWLENAYP